MYIKQGRFRPFYPQIDVSTHFGIEQKGMTFDHDFCYLFSFSSSLFFYEGREKGKIIDKSHAFLLDHILGCLKSQKNKM